MYEKERGHTVASQTLAFCMLLCYKSRPFGYNSRSSLRTWQFQIDHSYYIRQVTHIYSDTYMLTLHQDSKEQ